MKSLEIIHPPLLQSKLPIQLFQRDTAVRLKIPKCMIQVKKQMPVFHAAKYEAGALPKN
jgi:hypothetical protein